MSKEGQVEPLLEDPTIHTEFSEMLSSPPRTPRHIKWRLRIYVLLQFSCIIFVFACINYRDWIRYCWFQFGVQSADNIAVSESTFRQNIDYLRYLLCDATQEYHSTCEKYCPGFCDNLEKLVHAGGVMLFFMLYCVMLGSISVVLHVIKLINQSYKADFMRTLVISPAVALLVGCIVYLSVADFRGFRETNSEELCEADRTVNFELSGGALMWMFLFLLQVVTSLFGFRFTCKEFH